MATRTIIINPGQTVIIPKGVTVNTIVTEGNIQLTSTCTIPDPEVLVCTGFNYISQLADNDGRTDIAEANDSKLVGVMYNGVRYNFSTEIGFDESALDIFNQMKTILPIKDLIFYQCSATVIDGLRESVKRYLIIKSPSSFVGKLFLIMSVLAPNSGSGFPPVEMYYPLQLRSDIVDQGHESVCNCS